MNLSIKFTMILKIKIKIQKNPHRFGSKIIIINKIIKLQ